jgi:hypothetical protein
VVDYAFANCPLPVDTVNVGGPCDSASVAQVQADLIAQGFDCLIGAGPFACAGDVFQYAFDNCPPSIDTSGNPCDPIVVAQCQNDLIAQGFDCLVGAGPFDCLDELLNYAFINCPPNDTTWNNPCDPFLVEQTQNDLIAQGFDCLVGAGPFTCVNEVFDYAFANCPPSNDDCDPAAVQQAIDDLLSQGYDCLQGAGPFTCVHEVVCYALDNCPQAIDTVGLPPCLQNIPQNITTFQQFLGYLVNCDSTFVQGIPACWFTAPIFATDDEFIAWITTNCGFDSLMNTGNAAVQGYFGGQSVSGTKNLNSAFEMSVAPNPANSLFYVTLKNSQISRLEIIDVNGSLVLAQNNIADNQTAVNISALPSGLYMLRVFNTEQAVVTTRVVKQ